MLSKLQKLNKLKDLFTLKYPVYIIDMDGLRYWILTYTIKWRHLWFQ